MKLEEALGIQPGELVAFVGGRGRVRAAWKTLRLLVSAGSPVVLTTTTEILLPKGAPLILSPRPEPAAIASALADSPALVLAAGRVGHTDPRLVAQSPYPAEPVRLQGIQPELLGELARRLPGVTWVVEADTEQEQPLRAPGEPRIPPAANRVVVLAGLAALGRPLEDSVPQSASAAAQLLHVPPATSLTPDLFASLVGHASGGLKGVPARAEAVVLLTQQDTPPHPQAADVARLLLLGRRIRRVVLADLHRTDPVLEVWT